MKINLKQYKMKKIVTATLIAMLTGLAGITFAQTPPHPNGGGSPSGGGNTPVGGGAPIDGGILIMLSLAAGYGARKVADFRKKSQ
jgi:hypothetical protein